MVYGLFINVITEIEPPVSFTFNPYAYKNNSQLNWSYSTKCRDKFVRHITAPTGLERNTNFLLL